jgi:hypothetical protein
METDISEEFPTTIEPKSKVVGETERTGASPVPDKDT